MSKSRNMSSGTEQIYNNTSHNEVQNESDYDYILTCLEKTKRWLINIVFCCCLMPITLFGHTRTWVPIDSVYCIRKSNPGYVFLTFSVWIWLIFLGLHVLDYAKDTTFSAVLRHYDIHILNQNYTTAYERDDFYMDINKLFWSSIGLIIATYVFSVIYLMVSFDLTKKVVLWS